MMTSIIGAIIGKAIALELLYRWQEKNRVAAAQRLVSGALYRHGDGGGPAQASPAPKLLPPPR